MLRAGGKWINGSEARAFGVYNRGPGSSICFDYILHKGKGAWHVTSHILYSPVMIRRPNRKGAGRGEPAESLRDKSNVRGGWLPSLTCDVRHLVMQNHMPVSVLTIDTLGAGRDSFAIERNGCRAEYFRCLSE